LLLSCGFELSPCQGWLPCSGGLLSSGLFQGWLDSSLPEYHMQWWIHDGTMRSEIVSTRSVDLQQMMNWLHDHQPAAFEIKNAQLQRHNKLLPVSFR
jgi:hypothetical protein